MKYVYINCVSIYIYIYIYIYIHVIYNNSKTHKIKFVVTSFGSTDAIFRPTYTNQVPSMCLQYGILCKLRTCIANKRCRNPDESGAYSGQFIADDFSSYT